MTGPVRVKICGITRAKDAETAWELGADLLGFNFWPGSKRYLPPEKARAIVRALPPWVTAVGVMVNPSAAQVARAVRQSGVQVIQLHGDESPELCAKIAVPVIKGLQVKDRATLRKARAYKVSALLLDAPGAGFGGTGHTFDWSLLAEHAPKRPWLLAGGLNPDNVAVAVKTVRPSGVDVASGVERAPGVKDPQKLASFIRAAKEA